MIPIITHTASFYSLTNDINTDKEGYSLVFPNVKCNIQPVSANPAELATGVFDKKHTMFINPTYSGIREGMRVKIHGLYDGFRDRFFTIEGVEDWNNSILPHYQLSLSELRQ